MEKSIDQIQRGRMGDNGILDENKNIGNAALMQAVLQSSICSIQSFRNPYSYSCKVSNQQSRKNTGLNSPSFDSPVVFPSFKKKESVKQIIYTNPKKSAKVPPEFSQRSTARPTPFSKNPFSKTKQWLLPPNNTLTLAKINKEVKYILQGSKRINPNTILSSNSKVSPLQEKENTESASLNPWLIPEGESTVSKKENELRLRESNWEILGKMKMKEIRSESIPLSPKFSQDNGLKVNYVKFSKKYKNLVKRISQVSHRNKLSKTEGMRSLSQSSIEDNNCNDSEKMKNKASKESQNSYIPMLNHLKFFNKEGQSFSTDSNNNPEGSLARCSTGRKPPIFKKENKLHQSHSRYNPRKKSHSKFTKISAVNNAYKQNEKSKINISENKSPLRQSQSNTEIINTPKKQDEKDPEEGRSPLYKLLDYLHKMEKNKIRILEVVNHDKANSSNQDASVFNYSNKLPITSKTMDKREVRNPWESTRNKNSRIILPHLFNKTQMEKNSHPFLSKIQNRSNLKGRSKNPVIKMAVCQKKIINNETESQKPIEKLVCRSVCQHIPLREENWKKKNCEEEEDEEDIPPQNPLFGDDDCYPPENTLERLVEIGKKLNLKVNTNNVGKRLSVDGIIHFKNRNTHRKAHNYNYEESPVKHKEESPLKAWSIGSIEDSFDE